MSITRTLYANASALVDQDQPNTNFSSGTTAAVNRYYKHLLISFQQPEDALRYHVLQSLDFYAYGYSAERPSAAVVPLYDTFAEGQVTWNTRPGYSLSGIRTYLDTFPVSAWAYKSGTIPSSNHNTVINVGCALLGDLSAALTVQTSRGSSKPYLLATFADDLAKLQLSALAPAGGYLPKGAANTFSWEVTSPSGTLSAVRLASTVFRWRAGTSGTPVNISVGTDKSVTIPAGTFTTDTVQWQVEVTANSGAVTTSDWMTVSTQEALSTAETVSPADTVLDGSKPAEFVWNHVIETGTTQTGADLQYSRDNGTWITLAHVNGAGNTWTAAGNRFSAGPLYWRVRTYNTDNAAGTWSASANAIVIAASPAPIVAATASPLSVITWQAEGQQAAEVRVDGASTGPIYGTDKRYAVTEFLSDGGHAAEVRVQNRYGLWSEWGVVTFQVANAPLTAFLLSAWADADAHLEWPGVPQADRYYIYRDGTQIGETDGTRYLDRWAIGRHSYFVRAAQSTTGYYRDSDTLTLDLKTDCPLITAIDGDWLRLGFSTETVAASQVSTDTDTSLQSFNDADFPVPERSRRTRRSYTLSAAFKAGSANIGLLEGLVGREVFLKDQRGESIYGVMSQIAKSSNVFYTVFSVTVQQIEGSPG